MRIREYKPDKKKFESKLQQKITEMMIKIQNMCTRTPDIFDKLTNTYYGDNCTLMIIINNSQ